MLSTRVGGDGDGDGDAAHGKLECAGRLFKGGVLAIVGHLRLLLVPQYNHLGSQGSLFMRKIIDIHEFEKPLRRGRFCFPSQPLLHPCQEDSVGEI